MKGTRLEDPFPSGLSTIPAGFMGFHLNVSLDTGIRLHGSHQRSLLQVLGHRRALWIWPKLLRSFGFRAVEVWCLGDVICIDL